MPDGAPANCSSPQPVDDPIVVVGHPSVASFPSLCVNCAQPATPWFHYQQAFPRFGDEGQLVGHEVYGTRIPLCATCLDTEHRLAPPQTLVARLLLLARTWFVVGLAGSTVVCLFLIRMAVREAQRGAAPIIELLLGGVFAAIGLLHFRAAWNASRHMAIPPETAITSALSFSDDLAQLFETERHEYRFRNLEVARHFRAANEGRRWKANSPRARVAATGRLVVVTVAVTVVVLFVLARWLGLVE